MRKSRQGLQPGLSQKVESKLLISTKHTNTISTQLLAKLDQFRHEEHLQREYNLKFMTDRKRPSTQKSQKSLSSSKVTHKQSKNKHTPLMTPYNIQPQRLDFDSMDYRTKYYELHDEYITERRKNMELSEKAMALREAIGSFLNNFDSKSAQEVCNLLQGEKIKESLRRAVQSRRRAETGEGVLRQAMRILQVESWQQLVHNLRARVQRFRSMDQCTFKILELESINKRVVNDFEERLQRIREDQEEEWDRERQLRLEQIKQLQLSLDSSQRQKQSLRSQLQATLTDIAHLASQQPITHLLSGRSEVHDLQRLMNHLRNRLQEIEVQAEQNMFKLLKSNQEMVRLQRSIGQLRGEMQLQIEQLQQKNQQNLCQIGQLTTQLEQTEEEIVHLKQEIARKQTEKQRTARQEEDQRSLMAAALSVTDNHPAKLMLAIKEMQQKIETLSNQCQQLKSTMTDKDKLSLELQAQLSKSIRTLQETQQTTKTALFQKQQYKFLLNNLRDQFSEVKKQHQQQIAKTIQRKDEQIVASNRDILESHALLTDQLATLKSEHTRMTLQYEEAKASLAHFRTKAQQNQRLLVEKQGVVKRLSSQGERYRAALRQLQASFRDAAQLEQIHTKQIITLQTEKAQNSKMITHYTQKNAELTKSNEQVSREKNQYKTQLDIAQKNIQELKDLRAKLEASIVELRLEGLNKTSEITKLEEKVKNLQNEGRVLKSSNDKLMNQVNSVTRKLIAAKGEAKRRATLKLKQFQPKIKQVKKANETLKTFVKQQLAQGMSEMRQELALCLLSSKESVIGCQRQKLIYTIQMDCQHQIQNKQSQCQTDNEAYRSEYAIQCQIMASNLRQSIIYKLTEVLTALSLLRSQKNQIDEAVISLQSFTLEQLSRLFEEPSSAKLRQIQGSIEMIREDSLEEQQSELKDMAKIITPDEIFPTRSDAQQINIVLQALLEQDQIPSVPYWQRIQANFLAIRRKMTRRNNFRLDISAIDFKDPFPNSPHSSVQQTDLFRRMATDPDEPSQIHKETITNRSQRFAGGEALRRENEDLRMRLQQVLNRLGDSQDELQQLRVKLVKLQNETSIVGLQHNFKKVLDYLLNDNPDLFLQTCRILMKMLHFTEVEIKDFEEKLQNKRKRKKGGIFGGFFNV